MQETRYKCGCVNATTKHPGVMRCVSKCGFHKRHAASMGRGKDYYDRLGVFVDGIPQTSRQVREWEEAVGPFPSYVREPDEDNAHICAMEIGCGISLYAAELMRLGYRYMGLETDPWAAQWMRETYRCYISEHPFDTTLQITDDAGNYRLFEFELILAAHVLEHLEDAPTCLYLMREMLHDRGKLCILVPDDSDPVNPDHWWFFSPEGLKGLLEETGFVVEKMAVKKIVKHENFIYLVASRGKIHSV